MKNDVGEEIKRIRNQLGLSAGSFARLINSNECSIYYYENGRSSPRNPKIMKRARLLDKLFFNLKNNPDYLLEFEEYLNKCE